MTTSELGDLNFWFVSCAVTRRSVMTRRKVSMAFVVVVLVAFTWISGAMAQNANGATPADPWPRPFKLKNADVLVYQPQVDSWESNMLNFRAVLSITPAGSKREVLGVIWATARTQVDRVSRIVSLEEIKLTKSNFPTLPDNGMAYLRALQAQFVPAKRTISLDRLQAALVALGNVKPTPVAINNDPPRIIVSESPAILVPLLGGPVWRPVVGTRFERVINTEVLILREQGGTTNFLHLFDGWLSASTLTGAWSRAANLPPDIDRVIQNLAKSGAVDLLDGGKMQPKPSLAKNIPTIYVNETPAELIIFDGAPGFTPVTGTALRWASNTTAYVILDSASSNYYVLISGRWFRASDLAGPWTYVASSGLPADFSRIPVNSPAGVVLASVAGTPQAQEALIANSIPQTATVKLVDGPKFTSVIDGAPQFRPIPNTSLTYVVNSPTPIIVVSPSSYYALTGGIWFTGPTIKGPWVVATSVPAVIYTIPPTSQLHYVTYVKVYGATASAVYVGYTPGYLGTVVGPDGVVVFGTGYIYQPWVGTVYYAPPPTYGVMAQPVYNPAVGMSFGFALGYATASMTAAYYHPIYYPVYYHPAYYGAPCCGSVSANVYGQWGATTYSGTRTYYNNAGGAYGTSASGTYTNTATGTTGTYSAGHSYNPYTGQSEANASRTFNTTGGASGETSRGASYNNQTGNYSRSGSASVTGAGGKSESISGSTSGNIDTGQKSGEVTRTTGGSNVSKTTTTSASTGSGANRQTTVTDSQTGQSWSHTSGQPYSDQNGNIYKNSESGWQQHTANGWQNTSTPPQSMQSEEQGRGQGEERFNSFAQSGANNLGAASSAGRFGQTGGGGSASRLGAGGAGGGWADRFGGGGGGGFSGFRGRR
jgi:hypothetical protein